MKSTNQGDCRGNENTEEHPKDESRSKAVVNYNHPLVASEGFGFLKLRVQVDRTMQGKGIIHHNGRLRNGDLVGDLYYIGLGGIEGKVEFLSLYYNMSQPRKCEFYTLELFILDELRGYIQPKFIEREQVKVITLENLSLEVSNDDGSKVAYSLNYSLKNDLM